MDIAIKAVVIMEFVAILFPETAEWRDDVGRVWLEQATWELLNPDLDRQIADAAENSDAKNSDFIACLPKVTL